MTEILHDLPMCALSLVGTFLMWFLVLVGSLFYFVFVLFSVSFVCLFVKSKKN